MSCHFASPPVEVSPTVTVRFALISNTVSTVENVADVSFANFFSLRFMPTVCGRSSQGYLNICTVDHWLGGDRSERYPQLRTNCNHSMADGFERRIEEHTGLNVSDLSPAPRLNVVFLSPMTDQSV
ncbi:hypothetical protein C8Q76DRAFT_801963 [Earliella scabrosa]|nr:hypothetical protein C8Q76DRAFT_801963 [Earliella scabrosa]